MLKWDIFQNDDRVFGWVFFEQGFEVWGAGRQDHLVSFGALAVTGESYVTKRLFIPQMFEGGHHVGLEIIPAETKLLLIIHDSFLTKFWKEEMKIYNLLLGS